MSTEAPTPRTRVRRLPELGVYERDALNQILDEALICHVAYTAEDGDPRVIPTIHARIGDTLYFHGSRASQTLRALRDGATLAVTATIIDGIRFARSMFEHSMNYRSVVAYGSPTEVTDLDELRTVFKAITNHVAPGRGEDARMPTDDELRQTLFLKNATFSQILHFLLSSNVNFFILITYTTCRFLLDSNHSTLYTCYVYFWIAFVWQYYIVYDELIIGFYHNFY